MTAAISRLLPVYPDGVISASQLQKAAKSLAGELKKGTVTVFIWGPASGISSMSDASKESFGHVALKTHLGAQDYLCSLPALRTAEGKGFYVSFWPGGPDNHCGHCGSAMSHFHSEQLDAERLKKAQPRVYDLVIGEAYVKHIHEKISRMATARIALKWDILGTSDSLNPYLKHCAGLAIDLLKTGGVRFEESGRQLAALSSAIKLFNIGLTPLALVLFKGKQRAVSQEGATAKESLAASYTSTLLSLELAKKTAPLLMPLHPTASDEASLTVVNAALTNATELLARTKPTSTTLFNSTFKLLSYAELVVIAGTAAAFCGTFYVSHKLKNYETPLDVERAVLMAQEGPPPHKNKTCHCH